MSEETDIQRCVHETEDFKRPNGILPTMCCWKCGQTSFIIHCSPAPESSLLECAVCGESHNLGMLTYRYPDGAHPDALLERERCIRIAEEGMPDQNNPDQRAAIRALKPSLDDAEIKRMLNEANRHFESCAEYIAMRIRSGE